MSKAKKKTQSSNASAKKKAPRKKATGKKLVVAPNVGAAIRAAFGKLQSAGIEHSKLRREFLEKERKILETQDVHQREFIGRTTEAAEELGIDPARYIIKLDSMTFEKRG